MYFEAPLVEKVPEKRQLLREVMSKTTQLRSCALLPSAIASFHAPFLIVHNLKRALRMSSKGTKSSPVIVLSSSNVFMKSACAHLHTPPSESPIDRVRIMLSLPKLG
jgi:hypothetical protein